MSNSHYFEGIKSMKLPVPQRVKDYFRELHDQHTYQECVKENVHYIQEFCGELMMRTFSVRIRKNGEMQYSETVRRGEDLVPVFCNCDFGYLSGYLIDYGYEWNPDFAYEGWNKKAGYLWGKYINRDEIDAIRDPHHSYTYDTGMEYFEYILKLRGEPRIELLVKNGYAPLVKSLTLLNSKERNIAGILQVKPKWVEYLKGKNRNYLIACRKYDTVEEVEMYVKMLSTPARKPLLKYVKNNMGQYIRYAKEQSKGVYDINEQLYKDYLDMACKLGYPLDESRYLFPENIKEAHDQAVKETAIQKGNIMKEGFTKQFEKLKKYAYEANNLMIRPCRDNTELIMESELLHHCVRTYAERHAKGLTAIFFIRETNHPDTPLATLELQKKHVVQVRADHNRQPEKEVLEFVSAWKQKYKLV